MSKLMSWQIIMSKIIQREALWVLSQPPITLHLVMQSYYLYKPGTRIHSHAADLMQKSIKQQDYKNYFIRKHSKKNLFKMITGFCWVVRSGPNLLKDPGPNIYFRATITNFNWFSRPAQLSRLKLRISR
jgi:hypothetical protein